jgi:ribosomal protein S15P/S13E
MNIDFPPPSNGVYNNAGSSRRLANYLEHEDMERMEQGIYTEGFFNLTENDIYKSQVINDIDKNIGQLLKTDAKFYAIHVSPSQKELRAMGDTEQEQAEAMKKYIREVVIPEYARNFNKGLSAEDIKFYGKIHFSRSRSDNGLNMHCHLIVSRKDQSNKKKLSPLTNHKNTKKGTVKGGFDRKNLFEQVEKGFDKLFNFNRSLNESFGYYNIMKNGTISDQLHMQEKQIFDEKEKTQENIQIDNSENKIESKQDNEFSKFQTENQENNNKNTLSDFDFSSGLGLFTPNFNNEDEEPFPMKKKKKPKRGLKK